MNQQELEALSYFEVNCLVAKSLGIDVDKYTFKEGIEVYQQDDCLVACENGIHYFIFDNYCGDISDAWPIIFENSIDIEWPDKDLGGVGQVSRYIQGNTYIAIEFTKKEECLKVAMIVYLLMQGDNK